MKKIYQFLIFICIVAGTIYSLSSCYPSQPSTNILTESRQKQNYYYIPSTPNTPLQSQKYDGSLSVIATSNINSSELETFLPAGAELQASFMPAKHIGIIASYSFSKMGVFDSKYKRFEVGSGFVTQLSKNWHFETYAGLGSGKILNTHSTGSSTLNLTHFFIQPSMVVSNKDKKVQFGFVSKFAGVNFNVTDTSFDTAREPYSSNQIKSLYAQPFHIIWEPSFVFRAGWKDFQFHTGYSFSADLTKPDLYRLKYNISFGISLRMGPGIIW